MRGLDGGPVELPSEGTVVFLTGAFVPGCASACRSLSSENVAFVVPDAPVVAVAWLAAEGLSIPVYCDDRPPGAVARAWGVTGWGIGRTFELRGGVVTATARIMGQGVASDPPQRPPATAGSSWWPGLAATAVWVLVALAISRMAGGGAAVDASSAVAAAQKPDAGAPTATDTRPSAPHGPLPPTTRASADGLTLELTPLEVPNPGLLADSGEALGFGEAVAGDGRPDGWHTNDRGGSVTVAADGEAARFTYGSAAKIAFAAKPAPIEAGESVVVSLTLDPGTTRAHPAQIGVAFFHNREYLEQATRSIEAEVSGPVPLVLRATAPEGTNKVQLRWNFETGGKAGSFAIRDLRFEKLRATSTASFPLPHVLLLTIETLRVDHTGLGGYGRDTTPNLVRLASEGARFDNHYVQVPYTRPSLSALIASQYPQHLGVQDNVAMLPESAVTVAERFGEGGYLTSAFLAQFLLAQNYGFNQGFQTFFNFKNDTPADQPIARFKDWFAAHKHDNTFSWVHLFDPHGPYRPPTAVEDRFVGDALWEADRAKVPEGKGKQRGKVVPDYVFDEGHTDRRHYVARYDADIFYADQVIGELTDWLKAEGLDQSTLLVVTADHGESMTDHDKYFAHGTLWEHDIHVPLVVWAPGLVSPGKVVAGLTQHVDLVPTLLDYAGLSAEGTVGRSLRAMIDAGAEGRAFAVTTVAEKGVEREAVIGSNGLKVVVSPEGKVLAAYDLGPDPGEHQDVAKTRAADAEAIAALYLEFSSGGSLTPAVPTGDREISAAEKAQLEALGYAEGEGAP